jgi:phosphoribosylformylglycinamidine synthase
MSIVVAKKDIEEFLALAAEENLEAAVIAEVTSSASQPQKNRMVMNWRGKTIVNLSREFLNSNGAKKSAKVRVTTSINNEGLEVRKFSDVKALEEFIGGLNVCSQRGLIDRFDSAVGAATVTAPLGGKYQLTPAQSMIAKIPVLGGETKTCSIMSWGFDPYLSAASPYHGAVFAVVHSIAKIIAAGGSRKNAYLSFQEYFERLRDEPARWGKPMAALLGALEAQLGLETAAIGGKDSMSGSFAVNDNLNIDVPPTLVSFSVSTAKIDNIISCEFKRPDSYVYLFKPPSSFFEKHDFAAVREYFDAVEKFIAQGKALCAWAAGSGGTAEAVFKMCFGNRLGFTAEKELFAGGGFAGFVIETSAPVSPSSANAQAQASAPAGVWELLGRTSNEYVIKTPSFEAPLAKLQNVWEQTLEAVYPSLIKQEGKTETFKFNAQEKLHKTPYLKTKPMFLIPVFPGTNSEYDSARAIEKAGGDTNIFVIRNLTPADISQSVIGLEKAIRSSNVIFLPGGFSGGDEPAGSGKFITAFMRNPAVSDAVMELLQKRDGLICGICNGFQALIKLGLVPYGEIREMTEDSPTLTFNTIGRHQSTLVNTKVVSNKSPWLSHLELGSQYIVPVSHGEGRFTAPESVIRSLAANGQIATQYVDFDGGASQDIRFNPNNSSFAIEGITSPDGRVFGRMAHNERFDEGLYRNIPGINKMDIFAGAVGYFRGYLKE